MVKSLKTLENKAKKDAGKVATLKELDGVFRMYLGKKGELTLLLRSLAKLKKAERVKAGKAANQLKDSLLKLFEERKRKLQKEELETKERTEWVDITAPGTKIEKGHLHPLTHVLRRAQEIFGSMGFAAAQGPEIENEWYNFDALNIPPNHPARDMWDTFWLAGQDAKQKTNPKQRFLLRTHTSPVQVRYLEKHTPPLRIIVPGRIFRYEATDAKHEINFYQLEGLLVDKHISAANFIAVFQEFYSRFFGVPVKIRLRPSYFPFTEPSFEVDMTCVLCKSKGCSACGHAGWMEMMGAGMVHPRVFESAHYNPNNWQGFAFGMGVDRLAMMKYKIPDIRMFYRSDLRFLRQF